MGGFTFAMGSLKGPDQARVRMVAMVDRVSPLQDPDFEWQVSLR